MHNASVNKKCQRLKKLLKRLGSVVVAFSGGVDSSVMAKFAHDCLGKNALAVTAASPTYTASELLQSKRIARQIDIAHQVIKTTEFKDKRFLRNTRQRCYWCKRELFRRLRHIAQARGITHVIDGTNYSDRFDQRPGTRAAQECGVISPLYLCKITKRDIHTLAGALGFSSWIKPQGACLASRIPHGEPIMLARLERIERAERILRAFLGKNTLVRARDHNTLVRIEVAKERWTELKKSDITNMIKKLKKIGFRYVTIDLEGYIP
ncbi:MAG: ATP-dependent sacrificial sulfur transferase LarE, partial [Caldisericia bacterium]|nr:ATP-dependent sacrificial sulfur transferase LarE [Caldisericia bacterium]